MKLLKRLLRAEARASAAADESGHLSLLWATFDGPKLSAADVGPGEFIAQDICLEPEGCDGASLGWLRHRITREAEDVGLVYGLAADGVRWRDVIGRVLEVHGARVNYVVDRSDSSAVV